MLHTCSIVVVAMRRDQGMNYSTRYCIPANNRLLHDCR